MNEITLDILEHSRWEHFKKAKDMALIYPLDSQKRKEVEDELNNIIDKINLLNGTIQTKERY